MMPIHAYPLDKDRSILNEFTETFQVHIRWVDATRWQKRRTV